MKIKIKTCYAYFLLAIKKNIIDLTDTCTGTKIIRCKKISVKLYRMTPSEDKSNFRQNFFQEISTYCQQANTCPHIVQLLTAVFCQWFQGEDRPQILLRQYPAEIHHLIRSQQKNGWRHLFQGCFAVVDGLGEEMGVKTKSVKLD